jgi:hypothetical protein
MSTEQRATCPVCQRAVALPSGSGGFRPHGPRADPCRGSRRTVEQAEQYRLSALTGDQWELMRHCWEIGDIRPIELMFGITYPQPRYFCTDASIEVELAAMIRCGRRWIEALANRAKQTDRRIP